MSHRTVHPFFGYLDVSGRCLLRSLDKRMEQHEGSIDGPVVQHPVLVLTVVRAEFAQLAFDLAMAFARLRGSSAFKKSCTGQPASSS